MADATSGRWWRGFGWSWLDESGRNGAAKVLSALDDKPVGESAAATNQAPPVLPQELPFAVRLVLLWLELVAASGAAFLLLQVAWVAGAMTSNVWTVVAAGVDHAAGRIVARMSEGAATVFGLLTLIGWLFNRPRALIASTLFAVRRIRVAVLLLYFVIHLAVLTLVLGAHKSSSPESVTATHDSQGWRGTERLLTTLLVSPVTEELFFRGLVFQVVLNRTRSTGATTAVTSVLFAVLHIANARKLGAAHFTAAYLALQSVWALLVGAFLALQVSTSGSLTESVLLHSINNFFAMQMVEKMEHGGRIPIGAAAFVTYGVTIFLSHRRF